jgi:hypothetical protein
MEDQPKGSPAIQIDINAIMNTVLKVVTDPAGFYRQMPRSGGLLEPLIFMGAMGVLAGIVSTLLNIVGLGYGGGFFASLVQIFVSPIFAAIFGFVAAAVLFIIWKLLGSQEPFEVAYRCAAYATAIAPLTTLVRSIPYLGALIGLAWMAYLIIIASTEVHRIEPKKALIVFGAITFLLALTSISAERTARKMTTGIEKWHQEMGKMQEKTPEEAGRKAGEFLKGMQEGIGKEQK